VVDPGVGTARRPICLSGLGMLFVGPDNGLFTPVLLADPGAKAHLLSEKRFFRPNVSHTFHGRDIFAPVAGHLAAGVAPSELGPVVADPIRLDWPLSRLEKGALQGQVWGTDDFGNLYTNLTRGQVEGYLAGRRAEVCLGEIRIKGISLAYGQAKPGEILALFNSWDRLELAVNQGNLLKFLGLKLDGIYGLAVEVVALS